MAITKSNSATIAALNGLTATANGGKIRFYSGTVPATANTALTGQTPLGDASLNATAWGNATIVTTNAEAVLTTTVPVSGTVTATGPVTPTFFRVLQTDLTTVVFQGTAGAGGDITFDNNTNWATGGTITVATLLARMAIA
jgi:hypothetical protein